MLLIVQESTGVLVFSILASVLVFNIFALSASAALSHLIRDCKLELVCTKALLGESLIPGRSISRHLHASKLLVFEPVAVRNAEDLGRTVLLAMAESRTRGIEMSNDLTRIVRRDNTTCQAS